MSQELKQAHEELTEAIKKVQKVGSPDDMGILTDYIVISVRNKYDDEGDLVTAVDTIYRDGVIARHVLLGLIETVRADVRDYAYIAFEDDDEE